MVVCVRRDPDRLGVDGGERVELTGAVQASLYSLRAESQWPRCVRPNPTFLIHVWVLPATAPSLSVSFMDAAACESFCAGLSAFDCITLRSRSHFRRFWQDEWTVDISLPSITMPTHLRPQAVILGTLPNNPAS